MLHLRDKYFQSLREVASLARTTPEWSDYATFCEKYEQGLRNDAFTILKSFINFLEHAPFAERRRFVSWLLPRADGREGQHMLVPHPLSHRIVEPTLKEWAQTEPLCAEPHFWLGGYDNLKLALELTPDDEVIRRKLVAWILNRVDFATHELPTGYIGKPSEDIAALDEAEEVLAGLPSDMERTEFAAEVSEQRNLIQAYLQSRRTRVPPLSPD
jgi:hypothetical protein